MLLEVLELLLEVVALVLEVLVLLFLVLVVEGDNRNRMGLRRELTP